MVRSSHFNYLIYLTVFLFCTSVFIPSLAGSALPVDTLAGTTREALHRTNHDTLASNTHDTLTRPVPVSAAEQLIRGERLFWGLKYSGNNKMNCAGCHNTRFSDTLNWNPDAIEISIKYRGKNVADLKKVLLNPTGEKMARVHEGFTLTLEDLGELKLYMDKLAAQGLVPHKPVITNRLLFILASILFLLSTIDLLMIKKIKKQWITILVLSGSLIYLSYALAVDAIDIGHSRDYQPDQPIKFSHKVHAGQNATDCIYCHSYAPYSKTAGIPSGNVCMNCHLLVRKGTRSGTFEIAKIITNYESRTPIKWVKVYNLPDHVFFSHSQHVGAGGINCRKCHGPVEKMDRIVQYGDLSMGWCINCHRKTNVHFRENKFYSQYKDLSEKMRNGRKDSVTIADLGGTECMKCHY